MGLAKYRKGFEVSVHPDSLMIPHGWRKPCLVFVNSMSDLFHEDVPDQFIFSVFDVMNRTRRHTYQVLTKRPMRAVSLGRRLRWTSNIWLGTSVESEWWLRRVEILRESNAAIKFLSLEPLLGPLPQLTLDGIDWVIVGGESGPGARRMKAGWVREILSSCLQSSTPFFFKQWGGVNKKGAGRVLDGRTWDEFPLAGTDSTAAHPRPQ